MASTVILILYMRKLRLREVKPLLKVPQLGNGGEGLNQV